MLRRRWWECIPKIHKDVMELVDNTPSVEVVNTEQQERLKAVLLAKLEYLNPAGSVRGRVGKAMIRDVEQRGILKPGSVIVEPTSGNMGIGLASTATAKGYRMILTMPDTISIERRNILKAYGAEIVLIPGELGMMGAIEKMEELAKEIPGSFISGQFVNLVNPKVHMGVTGPEIWRDTQGKVDLLMASVGTGSTIIGIGTYLKRKSPDLKVIVAEPTASAVLSGKAVGPHGVQSTGIGSAPEVLDTGIHDEIITVDNDVPFATFRMLTRTEGLPTGISLGVVLCAAIQAAKWLENEGRTIMALLPDSGDRYYSTPLFVE